MMWKKPTIDRSRTPAPAGSFSGEQKHLYDVADKVRVARTLFETAGTIRLLQSRYPSEVCPADPHGAHFSQHKSHQKCPNRLPEGALIVKILRLNAAQDRLRCGTLILLPPGGPAPPQAVLVHPRLSRLRGHAMRLAPAQLELKARG